jgi:hypothetical protein
MDMHMDTGAMTTAMDLMDLAGRTMSTDWGTVSGQLSDRAGQLGQGELGAAFHARYEQAAAATTAAVEHHCRQPGLLATMGHQCAGLYVSADQNVAGAFDVPVD